MFHISCPNFFEESPLRLCSRPPLFKIQRRTLSATRCRPHVQACVKKKLFLLFDFTACQKDQPMHSQPAAKAENLQPEYPQQSSLSFATPFYSPPTRRQSPAAVTIFAPRIRPPIHDTALLPLSLSLSLTHSLSLT